MRWLFNKASDSHMPCPGAQRLLRGDYLGTCGGVTSTTLGEILLMTKHLHNPFSLQRPLKSIISYYPHNNLTKLLFLLLLFLPLFE